MKDKKFLYLTFLFVITLVLLLANQKGFLFQVVISGLALVWAIIVVVVILMLLNQTGKTEKREEVFLKLSKNSDLSLLENLQNDKISYVGASKKSGIVHFNVRKGSKKILITQLSKLGFEMIEDLS